MATFLGTGRRKGFTLAAVSGYIRAESKELRDKLEGDIADIEEKEERVHDATEAREVRLRRADVVVVRFGVLWVPASHRI